MGGKVGKITSKAKDMAMPELSPELLAIYVKAEFTAKDTDADGVLNREEVTSLLKALGVGADALQSKVNAIISEGEDTVDKDSYANAFVADKDLVEKTSRIRGIFSMVDKNKDGYATKDELQGTINTVATKFDNTIGDKIGRMDADKDGRISYAEYLAVQLNVQSKIPGK